MERELNTTDFLIEKYLNNIDKVYIMLVIDDECSIIVGKDMISERQKRSLIKNCIKNIQERVDKENLDKL